MISIIIPTLNEAKYLRKTLHALRVNGSKEIKKEVIVVDSGSKDKTTITAVRGGARVIYETDAPKGKYFVLNRGAEFATGDVLMFLDADSIVPEGYDQDIIDVTSKKGFVGGAFEFKLDGQEWGLRVVEIINQFRYRVFPWYYGDQGVFVKTSVFKKVKGYPKKKIMESSDLCRLLWKQGKLKLIKKDMLTSPRRFLKYGIFKVLGWDFEIWFQDLLGKDVEKYAEEYWEFNQH